MTGCKHCGGGRVTPSGAVGAAKIQTPETTEVRSWTALPLLDVTNVPDDLDLIGGSNKAYQSWRIPASYFLGGTLSTMKYNVAMETEIEAAQVKPVRFSSSSSSIIPAKAVTGLTAQALAVASEDGTTTLMNGGFFTFDRPHMYEVGKTYYLSQTDEGEVISVAPGAGIIQPLFSVIDQLTIAINITLI